jgi:hypothetical protein
VGIVELGDRTVKAGRQSGESNLRSTTPSIGVAEIVFGHLPEPACKHRLGSQQQALSDRS